MRHDGINLEYAQAPTLDQGARVRLDRLERFRVDRVYNDGGRVVIDVANAHRHDLDIISPRWAALARYGDKCTDGVRNVITIIQNPASKVRALNLTTPGIGEWLEAANNKDLCPTLFEPEGMAY